MKKATLSTILIVFSLMSLQAQFLKNLQKKVEKRVENTVTNKVADKAATEAGKSVDSMLDFDIPSISGVEQVDPSEIPGLYEFDWSYVMKMESRQGEMILNYFLKKDAQYFGMKLPENDMYMVMDASRNLNVIYIRGDGNNMVMASKLPKSLPDDLSEETSYGDDLTFKKIGNKTILGYECEGYQGENSDMVFTFYITHEPDISFGEIYQQDKTNLPKGFDPKWIQDGKGIMMQMVMEGKKNSRENTTMTCISLEKKNFSLNKGDYTSKSDR